MAYLLGGNTLPNPVGFRRETIEQSTTNQLLNGTTKKDIINRKEKYTLNFKNLTQAQAAVILSEYDLQTVRNFEVTENNLIINATSVHIDIDRREYNNKGNDYREDLTVVLTEVI